MRKSIPVLIVAFALLMIPPGTVGIQGDTSLSIWDADSGDMVSVIGTHTIASHVRIITGVILNWAYDNEDTSICASILKTCDILETDMDNDKMHRIMHHTIAIEEEPSNCIEWCHRDRFSNEESNRTMLNGMSPYSISTDIHMNEGKIFCATEDLINLVKSYDYTLMCIWLVISTKFVAILVVVVAETKKRLSTRLKKAKSTMIIHLFNCPLIGKYLMALWRVHNNEFDPTDPDKFNFEDSRECSPGFRNLYAGYEDDQRMDFIIREAERNMNNVMNEHSDVNARANYYLVLDGVILTFIYSSRPEYSFIPGIMCLLSISILLYVISHGSTYRKAWGARDVGECGGTTKKVWRLTDHVNFDIEDPTRLAKNIKEDHVDTLIYITSVMRALDSARDVLIDFAGKIVTLAILSAIILHALDSLMILS